MTKAGEKLLAGAREALVIARGEVQMTERVLPSGVHVLSPSSATTLERAHQRASEAAARHIKPVS